MLKRLLGNQLVGHASIYLGATLVSTAIPFLLLPFLTRWLGPAEFGIMGAFLALVGMLGTVIGLATHGLISVVYFRDGERALAPQAGASVAIAAASSVFWWVLVFLLRERIAAATGIPADWLWTVVLGGTGQFLINVLLTIFQTLKKPLFFGAVQFGYAATLAVATIALVGLHHTGWAGRALAQIGAAATVVILGFLWLTRTGLVNWKPRAWPVRSSLAFGLPLLPHTISAMAMASVDRLALSSGAGPADVGYYYAAFQVAMVLTVVATALNQAWLPWLYERLAKNNDSTNRSVVKATYGIMALLFCGALFFGVLADWIIPLIAGTGFDLSIPLLRLLAPAAACSACYFFVAAFFFYEQRTGTLSMVTFSAAALQTILSFSLVTSWGSEGVAWATLASSAYYLVVTWFVANRIHPMPWLGRQSSSSD